MNSRHSFSLPANISNFPSNYQISRKWCSLVSSRRFSLSSHTINPGMDFQLDDSSNFTSLLQQSTPINLENFSLGTTPDDVIEGTYVGKRGKNFTADEDKLLVSAWLNTSLDLVDGNNMKGDHFWGRVEAYFIQGKHVDWSVRTRSSLTHRWGTIQLAVNKFCGFHTQIEGLHRSGVSNEDNIQEARKMFLTIMKTAFTFDHCWVILKDQEKWKKRDQLSAIKRKKLPRQSNNSTPGTINLGDSIEPNKEINNERPVGRKAAKERKKMFGDVPGFTNILLELKDEKQKIRAEKIEKINLGNEQKSEFLQVKKSQLLEAREANRIQHEKLQLQSRIENEKLQLERDREDTNIMTKDLSSMDSQQQ